MLEEVIEDSSQVSTRTTRPPDSFPRRSTRRHYIPPSVDLLPPLLTKATFGQTLALRARGGVFLAVSAKTAKTA